MPPNINSKNSLLTFTVVRRAVLSNEKLIEIDRCIARLYQLAAKDTKDYRRLALAQLAQVINFDGALWGTGHLDSKDFHSVEVLGVDTNYPSALAKNKDINPFYSALKASPGQAIDLSAILTDDIFHTSPVYRDLFSVYGIERIIGVLLPDASTGIMSIISLYRFDHENSFSSDDKNTLQRMVYHLASAASHAYFLHLKQKRNANPNAALAICDRHGLFFEVQPKFIELLQQYYPHNPLGRLPFSLNDKENSLAQGSIQIEKEALGDLVCISIWETSPLDLLSPRELEVVQVISRGLSFKEAAREMGVAPSTVSNHIYKVYRKLNISRRFELAQVVNHSK